MLAEEFLPLTYLFWISIFIIIKRFKLPPLHLICLLKYLAQYQILDSHPKKLAASAETFLLFLRRELGAEGIDGEDDNEWQVAECHDMNGRVVHQPEAPADCAVDWVRVRDEWLLLLVAPPVDIIQVVSLL